ncbi:MAG: hypothetical protein HFJ12_02705 [Bacilli bacterium]|nr:hypothetical protein [Bacilli bacterium]
MNEIILFLMTYLFVFFIYQIFIIRKAKRKNSKKRPMEVNYLINKYHVDIKRINYKKLLLIISLVSSLDISILVTIILIFDSYFIKIVIALLLVIPIIVISYHFIGSYYKKKGMVIDV